MDNWHTNSNRKVLLPSRRRKNHLGSEVEPEPVWRHQWPSLVSLSKHPAEGKVQDVCAGVVAHNRSSPCLRNNQMTVKFSPLVDIFNGKYWPLRARRVLMLFKDVPLRTRRALSIFKDVPLRTRRAISLYKVYGDSTLPVLNIVEKC